MGKKINQQKAEAFGYFVEHAASSFINMFKAVVPEIQKFSESLDKISEETHKIKNKPVTPEEPVTPEKPEEPVKSDFKVLS